MPARVSIVVVSFNTRDLLRRCLASIVTSPSPPSPPSISCEIVVVDNGSADGSAEMVENEFPTVRLIAAGQNLGFAKATNLGLGESGGDLLLLLNPDTEVLDAAIPEMVAFLEAHSEVAAVGPALLYGDGTPQHSAFGFPTLWMSFLDLFPVHHRLLRSRLNGRYPLPTGGEPFPVDHPLGAAMMIRRGALEAVGLLDEDFFIYCEEVDWAVRARRAGWQIYCLPSAQVIHHSGQSTRQFREKMLVELHRSRYRLFRKHYTTGFIRAHRLMVRAWLVRERLAARWMARRGEISPDELERRLTAYRTIWEM